MTELSIRINRKKNNEKIGYMPVRYALKILINMDLKETD